MNTQERLQEIKDTVERLRDIDSRSNLTEAGTTIVSFMEFLLQTIQQQAEEIERYKNDLALVRQSLSTFEQAHLKVSIELEEAQQTIDSMRKAGLKVWVEVKNCELCMGEDATTTVEYQDLIWDVCERCKSLAKNE